jgi:hypothetical protein
MTLRKRTEVTLDDIARECRFPPRTDPGFPLRSDPA